MAILTLFWILGELFSIGIATLTSVGDYLGGNWHSLLIFSSI